jgi:AraC-like DNA-binding protein
MQPLEAYGTQLPSAEAMPIAVTQFSTDLYAANDRHEAWANRDWPAIGQIFETEPTEPLFYNRSDRFALGGVSVHVAEMGAQRYRRTATMARRDGLEQLIVELLLEGNTRGDAHGRSTRNVPGGLAFNDLSQAHSHQSSNTRTILLSLPRAVAVDAGLDPRALHGVNVASAHARLLHSHLMAIHATLPELTVADGERLGRTVLDLLGIALDTGGGRAPAASSEARDTALTLAAREAIEARLRSPTLTPDWLCRHLGISRSTLYRLFEASGGVLGYIRGRRLERVRETLVLPGPRPRLADLAESWGFSDAAHLSRLFRGQYGVTPGEYRMLQIGGERA